MVSSGFGTEGEPETLDNCKPYPPVDSSSSSTAYTASPMGLDDVIESGDGSAVTLDLDTNESAGVLAQQSLVARRDLAEINCKSQSGPPSLINNVNPNTTVTPPAGEENYEGFGYADDLSPASCASPTNGHSSTPSKNFNNSPVGSTLGRHTWLRTSLRRTPANNSAKTRQLGSNALASHLYRSSSFNSSGRGSTCDAADDMYSDVSLEDDVIDLNHRVRMIQEQMDALVDTQSNLGISSERYARVKEENATLQARVLMLEEAAKDAQSRAEERLQAEQRRHRELLARLEREKQLEIENFTMKMQNIEIESSNLREQITRLRQQLNLSKEERERLENSLDETTTALEAAKQAERQAAQRETELKVMLDAAREELSHRHRDRQRMEELLLEVARLSAKNKSLEESRDELQAAAALQVGRELLLLPSALEMNQRSLAAELSENSRDKVDSGEKPRTQAEALQSLKEQQEVNAQLRAYIDNILLNIVENYPQLLEVKQPPPLPPQ